MYNSIQIKKEQTILSLVGLDKTVKTYRAFNFTEGLSQDGCFLDTPNAIQGFKVKWKALSVFKISVLTTPG